MAEERKVASEKPVAKKTPVKKGAVKKSPTKVTATKVASAKKPAAKKVAAKKNTVSVTLVKSFYGRLPSHRATITGLGLKRINHTVELLDTPEVRGMINKVSYLLKVEG
ncbi:50S ribosomal protein L30 [bacterium endosymbiont of Bathymodiolus sp. 5 South]|jgi:large subunit ribosomal protein L30|uniref:50S ribosomal protein L30 n=1 Tax=bacterium endosymbiont of Bathymodiolus sp. 5 South TaxID=1181670 RepID=UPI0010B52377|nr:50S ribosomal protein L30 [bacterium endosymbiont of Bathymodiolus sp. 5 South]VVH59791.1 LSU ribosomal protein L30p (L7e) [uncultured Gammaproteobacteria bacterium]SHN89625.1 LSU ribosomal protein L30p (L7e) [bacterium endosymbiont of Bathymodiolus sp. 5 South]SSC08620.1 LSU ribosomal protein L30p (L7e) [bacterium endosymbiont of Bathymodiolus sp. 5 South]VVH61929.1 LSU ribosomal protein L30p (L7e) [uncultured Gammaproteobacteria bacterium]VVM23796.1 LSU ribosomal protein L30p (L7e) [uncul